MPDGNDAQLRKVAFDLFDMWKEQEKKSNSAWKASAPAWIACVMSLLAVFWQVAITAQRVSENTRRIDQVEVQMREQSRDNKTVTERLARIEAKLDLVVGKPPVH